MTNCDHLCVWCNIDVNELFCWLWFRRVLNTLIRLEILYNLQIQLLHAKYCEANFQIKLASFINEVVPICYIYLMFQKSLLLDNTLPRGR